MQIGCRGLAAAAVGFDVKGELLPLVKAAHAGALDGGDVDEHIRAARVLHDEAVALLGVEKLNGTCSHNGLHLKTRHAFVAVRTIRAVQSGFCVFLRKPSGIFDLERAKPQGKLNREWRVYIQKRFAFGNCEAMTPEGQPQLLDRGAALSSLVVRGGDVEVEVCDPVFVDPERVRLNG